LIGRQVGDDIVQFCLGTDRPEKWVFPEIAARSFLWRAFLSGDDGVTLVADTEFQLTVSRDSIATKISVVLPARDQTVTDDDKQMTDEQRRGADDLNSDETHMFTPVYCGVNYRYGEKKLKT